MIARIRLFAAVIAALLSACDTERNVLPVFETYFTKYYGEDGNQYAVDLAVNADGTMVMVGESRSQTNPGITRSFIVKTDPQGVVLWQRQTGADNEAPADVEFDSQNNILVMANVSETAIRITRISQSGAGVDSLLITHPGGVRLAGTGITQVADGNIIVTGYAGPDLVNDPQLPPPADESDLLIYRVGAQLTGTPELLVEQGGEHVGKIVRLFQSTRPGPVRYYRFGDSDRSLASGGRFRQTFEVVSLNEFFVAGPLVQSGPDTEIQVARDAIAMPVSLQQGFVMVGSSILGTFSQIFLTQYIDAENLIIRQPLKISTPRSMEGVSVAYGDQDAIYILADERQDNNNYDIYLIKLASDGTKLGELRFGSLEGNDQAAAVRVLPDQRVAVFGTIQLETQTKMMLTLISPQGTFSE